MLCRKLRQTFAKTTLNYNVHYQCLITSRYFSKRCIFDSVFAAVSKSESRARMSSIRFMLKDLSVSRFWVVWTRSFILNNVVKRCRRERSVREVFQCFRQTILKPRRTFLLSATAAFKSKVDDDETPPSCEQNITDEDLEALVTELEGVEQLSRSTLFCTSCGKRLVIEKQLPGVRYCACKDSQPAEESLDGWMPYMEAEDVVIWRKEYKPGQGLYAYKVYGRYKEVLAQDFAAVQVDGAYRRAWDAAVAALTVVERRANGVRDQAVLHWEVLWPRLFANRDYVYIRRHKEFDVKTPSFLPHKDGIFATEELVEPPPETNEQPSVHSRAKRKSQENDRRNESSTTAIKDNKVFIIISRACSHPSVPVTKHAIRVNEYWSHMVVKSINGVTEPGMEFVLTYYDEPAVGGMPSGVASWATGRAAPAYLGRMRLAAHGYRDWSRKRGDQKFEDFAPFGAPKHTPEEDSVVTTSFREQDMESSKDGPEIDSGNINGIDHRDESTQTETEVIVAPPAGDIHETTGNKEPSKDVTKVPEIEAEKPADIKTAKEKVPEIEAENPTDIKTAKEKEPEIKVETPADIKTAKEELSTKQEGESDKLEEDENNKLEEDGNNSNGSWWRYLYPFYYFV